MTTIGRPAPDEYGAPYAGYVSRLPPDADILAVLADQRDTTRARFVSLSEEQGRHRYAPGKWSVKEVMLHLSDVERIMAYRALRVARGDTTPLPGFDENAYTPLSGADAHSVTSLADELRTVRQATLSLFEHLPEESWTRRGTASGMPVSVRALAWIIAGHEQHHLAVLGERYGLWNPLSTARSDTR
jgi:hypothetical protein